MKCVGFFGSDNDEKNFFLNYLLKEVFKINNKHSFFYPIINYKELVVNLENKRIKLINFPPYLYKKEIKKDFIKRTIKNECDLLCWIVKEINEENLLISREVFKKEKKEKCIIFLKKNNEQEIEKNDLRCLGTDNIFFLEKNSDVFSDFINFLIKNLSILDKQIKEKNQNKNEKKSLIKLMILGLPNSGKSTLMNSLLKKERSLVSTEKTTLETVHSKFFLSKKAYLDIFDTKGINKKKQIKESEISSTQIMIIVIESISPINKEILKIISLSNKFLKPSIIVINKIDLVSKQELKKKILEIKKRIQNVNFFYFKSSCLIKNIGIFNIKKTLSEIIIKSKKNFEKKELDNLKDEIEKKAKVNIKSLNHSIKKMQQNFTIISKNKASVINTSEKKYIIRLIQKKLLLNNIPIKLSFNHKKN